MLTGPGATIAKARKLRRTMSLPEVLLWRELRRRPGGFKFRRQHPAGPFILDFACVEARLAIEIDGDAHSRTGAPDRDIARDQWLMTQDYRTVRIPARVVLKDMNAVISLIVAECEALAQPLHHPSGGPPPRIGEDL